MMTLLVRVRQMRKADRRASCRSGRGTAAGRGRNLLEPDDSALSLVEVVIAVEGVAPGINNGCPCKRRIGGVLPTYAVGVIAARCATVGKAIGDHRAAGVAQRYIHRHPRRDLIVAGASG